MKQDKAEKIIKKAEKKAEKAAAQLQVANKKAEAAAKKQAAQAEKKAARVAKNVEKKATRVAQSAKKKAAQKAKKAEQAAKKAQLATKKAEEKKAKALAKLGAKATTTAGEGGEEGDKGAGKKKKGKKPLLIVAPILLVAVGVGAFFFLRGGGEEGEDLLPEPISAPAEYVLNEAHISALPVWGEDVLVYQEEVYPESPAPEEDATQAATTADTTDGQEGEEEDEAPQAEAQAEETEVTPLTLYRYEGLQSPKDLVAAYTALMTSADAGFSTVDEDLLRIDPPEIGSRGSVQLARNAPAVGEDGEDCVHSLLLSWDDTSCTVTLDTPDGEVHDPKPEPTPVAPSRSLSDLETIHPSKLGLPGDSMDAYELMPQEGSVLIAGNPSPCMRVNVYGENSQIAGSYFISGDGHLYKLDDTRNAVVELDWE